MKRKLMALLMALMMCCPVTALAAEQFVTDEAGYLEDAASIEETAQSIYDSVGLGVYTVITDEISEDDMETYMDEITPAGDNIVLLVLPEEEMFMIHGTGAGDIVYEDEDFYDILCDAYNLPDTYQEGVQTFYDAIAYIYDVSDTVPVIYPSDEQGTEEETRPDSKPSPIPRQDGDFQQVERTLPLVVDFAGVLRESDKSYLNDIANSIARQYPYEIAVAFVDSLEGMDVMEYADDFYDYNGYGAGENDDGFLLLICPSSRDYWMTTCGLGEQMFDEKRMKDIDDTVVKYLRENDWAGAAHAFLTESEKCMEAGMPEPERPGIAALLGSLLIGLGLGTLPVVGMEKQLKTVQAQNRADDWVKGNGVVLTNSYDRYITTHVRTRRIESSSSGSRSSGSHTSSSGRSHSGRGGKF